MHERSKNEFTCDNCGASLQGRWCHHCGQKRLGEGDRRFGHLLGQFAHELFHADGKVPATLTTLLFRPGRLTRAYLDGQRVRYLTPIALFLLINLVYFLAPPLTDFNLDLDNQLYQPYGELIRPLVDRRAEEAYSSMAEFRDAYDQRVHRVAKSLIILHLPLLALVLLVLNWRHRMFYAEHFVIASHLFSFLLAALLVVAVLFAAYHGVARVADLPAPAAWVQTISQWGFLLLVLVWWLVALRRCYMTGWLRAMASLVGWVAGLLLVHLFIYRPVQFFVVLAWL